MIHVSNTCALKFSYKSEQITNQITHQYFYQKVGDTASLSACHLCHSVLGAACRTPSTQTSTKTKFTLYLQTSTLATIKGGVMSHTSPLSDYREQSDISSRLHQLYNELIHPPPFIFNSFFLSIFFFEWVRIKYRKKLCRRGYIHNLWMKFVYVTYSSHDTNPLLNFQSPRQRISETLPCLDIKGQTCKAGFLFHVQTIYIFEVHDFFLNLNKLTK